MTYKPIPTTKAEMLDAIEELAIIALKAETVNDRIRRQEIGNLYQHIGKLRSLAGHLPEGRDDGNSKI